MRIQVFASGSSGNCTYIETADRKILIDAGISKKSIDNELAKLGLSFKDIDLLLITHEHIDHISSLGTILKQSRLTCYMTEGTYSAILEGKNRILSEIVQSEKQKNRILFFTRQAQTFLYTQITFPQTDIEILPTFHDAKESVGFKISSENKSIVFLTDTGYVHQSLYPIIQGADCYVLECNHDPQVLMCSDRPYSLKMRILSDHGHLSNEDAMVTLAQVMGVRTKLVFYAHISQECNLSEIVEMTRKKVMEDYGIDTTKVEFVITSPFPGKIYEI